MKRLVIGASAIALLAIPAWAIAEGNHDKGMRGPQTRTEVEARVKEYFAKVDTNKDGIITKEEAEAFKAARRAEMRDRMFTMLDTDRNGEISRQEFDAHHGGGMDQHHRMGRMGGGMKMMQGSGLFAKADGNNDGKVTLSEATSRALEMFDRADTNKDGTVTPEERRAAWKSWMEQRHEGALGS